MSFSAVPFSAVPTVPDVGQFSKQHFNSIPLKPLVQVNGGSSKPKSKIPADQQADFMLSESDGNAQDSNSHDNAQDSNSHDNAQDSDSDSDSQSNVQIGQTIVSVRESSSESDSDESPRKKPRVSHNAEAGPSSTPLTLSQWKPQQTVNTGYRTKNGKGPAGSSTGQAKSTRYVLTPEPPDPSESSESSDDEMEVEDPVTGARYRLIKAFMALFSHNMQTLTYPEARTLVDYILEKTCKWRISKASLKWTLPNKPEVVILMSLLKQEYEVNDADIIKVRSLNKWKETVRRLARKLTSTTRRQDAKATDPPGTWYTLKKNMDNKIAIGRDRLTGQLVHLVVTHKPDSIVRANSTDPKQRTFMLTPWQLEYTETISAAMRKEGAERKDMPPGDLGSQTRSAFIMFWYAGEKSAELIDTSYKGRNLGPLEEEMVRLMDARGMIQPTTTAKATQRLKSKMLEQVTKDGQRLRADVDEITAMTARIFQSALSMVGPAVTAASNGESIKSLTAQMPAAILNRTRKPNGPIHALPEASEIEYPEGQSITVKNAMSDVLEEVVPLVMSHIQARVELEEIEGQRDLAADETGQIVKACQESALPSSFEKMDPAYKKVADAFMTRNPDMIKENVDFNVDGVGESVIQEFFDILLPVGHSIRKQKTKGELLEMGKNFLDRNRNCIIGYIYVWIAEKQRTAKEAKCAATLQSIEGVIAKSTRSGRVVTKPDRLLEAM